MTTQQPHTIVIKTLPTKIPTTLMVSSQLEHDMLDDLYGDETGTRKRRRLTHLSQDEKLLRRKLKNRVAAQTARDRKKNIMSDLELKVAELVNENKKLARENHVLKCESGSLQKENYELKERLGDIGCVSSKPGAGIGSAVSTELQPKGQTLPVSYWTNTFATSMLTLSLTLLLASSQSTRRNKSCRKHRQSPQSRPSPYRAMSPRKPILKIPRDWWGPQQQSWNPTKN